ncbi:hypothetical protein DICVIV_12151 [Dictyocaulus viviparus]|uniref:DUF7808 domain-containing protein n=1 Tax=Dictyocaulus viviparus TaxID=29172 RepID=A0A0D8XHQ7_DICVI|nr:hypothetical protein DICVIV_12151 [Dictyocaulus viviparus]
MWLCSITAVVLLFCNGNAAEQSTPIGHHYQSRYVKCVHELNNNFRTSCSVLGKKVTNKSGGQCLDDFELALKNVRTMCPTYCGEADEFEIVHKVPPNNHVCIKFHNYGLIRRKKDVYLWRRGECKNETITFTVNCGFTSSRKNLERTQNDPSLYFRKLLARQ